MKKTILIIALVVLALGALGIGVAFAQDAPQTYGPGMVGGYGRGWMHEYVEQALAEKLGITEAAVEEQLAAGKTMYQIALDNGIAEDEVAAFLTEVHAAAFDKAVADGVITREQADLMLERMQANGFNYGNCPMQSGQAGQYGQGYGPGMMQNWRDGQRGPGMMNRWQNQNP
jgi:hypothetical protein